MLNLSFTPKMQMAHEKKTQSPEIITKKKPSRFAAKAKSLYSEKKEKEDNPTEKEDDSLLNEYLKIKMQKVVRNLKYSEENIDLITRCQTAS